MITFSIFLQVPSIIRLTMSETDQTPDIPPDAPPDTSAPDASTSDTSGIRPQAKRKLKAAYPQRKKVCERLDVGYPLDNLKGAQVPKSLVIATFEPSQHLFTVSAARPAAEKALPLPLV